MKKKVCRWLDSNEMGGLLLNDKRVTSCCTSQSTDLVKKEGIDFSTLTKDEIQNPRIALYESLNNGTKTNCDGCLQLIEKEEEDIEIGAVEFLPIGRFNTCNFRCKYCGFTDEQLHEKLEEDKRKILPVVKNLHNHGLLKQTVSLGLTGGEPTLFEDIYETCEFLAQNYKTPQITIFSNSSLTERAEKLAPKMSKLPRNITRILLTSFDAGTPETYKEVRGQDLFYDTINNIINYTKHNSFDVYVLKYIFQLDFSNTSDEDVFGYLQAVKLIAQNYSKNVKIIIDRDCGQKVNECVDEKIIEAAAKIYYAAKEVLEVPIESFGSAFTDNIGAGKKDLERIYEYAEKYKYKEKTAKEKYYLNLLGAKNGVLSESATIIKESENRVKEFIKANKNKRVCFYGAGIFAQKVFQNYDFSDLNILGIIDKDEKKHGTEICGHKIYSAADLKNLDCEVLALSVLRKRYVLDSLEKLKEKNAYGFDIVHDLFKGC